MNPGDNDPIIEAHRIVAAAERGVGLGDRWVFAQRVGHRQVRVWWQQLRGWWVTADSEVKQMVFMLAAIVFSELAARFIRPNGGL